MASPLTTAAPSMVSWQAMRSAARLDSGVAFLAPTRAMAGRVSRSGKVPWTYSAAGGSGMCRSPSGNRPLSGVSTSHPRDRA